MRTESSKEASAQAMASNNNNGKEKKEVMQSNLPLLFANGSPISLESLNLSELQRFLLFLLKCECGRTINSLSELDPPGWWPSEIAFEDDLLEKSTKKGMWSSVMRKLIHKCYDHHGAGFLLEFSRKLMIATQDSNKIKVIDNGDGTRSMRSAVSDKLLVTFRSENQDYDKKQRQQNNSFSTQSPLKKRCSLSLGINASDPRLPRCEDIFLCDNCGSSFKSLSEVLDHEKSCQQAVDTKKAEEFHKKFFSYFKLAPSSGSLDSSSCSSKVVRPKPSTYAKFLSIDVCSPLGQYIYSLSSNTKDEIDISSLCMAERKSALRSVVPHKDTYSEKIFSKSLYFPPLVVGGHGTEFPITYRRNRLRSQQGRQEPHLYCFNKQHKAVRAYTLKYGLTPRAMRLYKDVRKRYPKVALMRLDVTNILKAIEDSERERLLKIEEKRQAKLKILKIEQARQNMPYIPKLTISTNSKGSSYSVLQSFTSAVQLLCSPEKSPSELEFDRKNRQMTSSQQNKQAPEVVASLEKRSESFSKNQSSPDSSHQILPDSRSRFQNDPNSESRNQIQIPEQSTRPLYPNNYKARSEAGQEPEIVVKKVVSKTPANQCIDLIILSDSDEELECNHLTIR